MTLHDKDPDIVQLVLSACKAEGFDPAIAALIERKICDEYGGQRLYIPKKKKERIEEKQKKIFQEGLTNKTNEQIIKENGISRASLYRYMKRG